MERERNLRILIAKPGLDGHDRGARVIARAFRDAGFEVIYTGCHQTPEQIVSTAIQEDVDMIGLSILSGAHTYSFPRILELLKENGAGDEGSLRAPLRRGAAIPSTWSPTGWDCHPPAADPSGG